MQQTPPPSLFRLAGACALALGTAMPALAVDFDGYMRAGPGAGRKDSSRSCYSIGGDGLTYRLGNECDIYAEFGLAHRAKTDNGVEWKVKVTPALWNGATDTGDSRLNVKQLYTEGKGFDVSPETSFWVGKRFWGRADVHIVDTFFVRMDGVGAGLETPLGGGQKLGAAYFHADQDAKKSIDRLNVDYSGIASNPGGSLRLVGTLTHGNYTGGRGGAGLVLQHDQADFLAKGFNNTLWVAFAKGTAGLQGNANDGDPNVRSWRLVESVAFQQGAVGGQLMAMVQRDRMDNGDTARATSLGGRLSFAMSKHFKWLVEAGHSTKAVGNSGTQSLSKLTVGPALGLAPGFWSRPELRLYMTTARWNDAANKAAGAAGVNGRGDGKTSGNSLGAQFEIWF